MSEANDIGDCEGGGCEEFLEQLQEFIDQALTDENRNRIETHLNDCPPCADAHKFEAELRMVISHRCQEQVPESLRDRIAQALRTEQIS